MVKYLYIIFIGILFSLCVAAGIAAFYPQPKHPDYPIELSTSFPEKEGSTESAAMREKQIAYEKKSRDYQKVNEEYNRNVSLIAMGFAVVFVLLGVILAKSIIIFPDGLLLGGIGTLLYSIIRGFNANDDIFRFMIVASSLIIAIIVGFIKFIKKK